MDMRVLLVETGGMILRRNNNKVLSNATHLLHEEKAFEDNKYYVFSIRVQSNQVSLGIESKSDGQILGSFEQKLEANNERARRFRFVVIDTQTNKIYYDGSIKDVELIMKDFFDYETPKLTSEVDLEELKYLTQFSVITKYLEEPGLFDNSVKYSQEDSFNKLFSSVSQARIKEERYSIKLEEKAEVSGFFKEKFVPGKQIKNNENLYFEGLDEYGNELVYDSFLSRKIKILPECETFDDKIDLELKEILIALKEKVDPT